MRKSPGMNLSQLIAHSCPLCLSDGIILSFSSPSKVTGKCGSVLVRLIPAPRGTSIVAAAVPKKLLQMAGVSDCYTCARGQTATLGNFGEWVETLGSLSWLVGRHVGDIT